MSEPLDLGCFSVSLAVDDLEASLAFYTALGFSEIGGEGQWRILSNGSTKIGLFAEHIEETILTFNPGLPQEFAPGDDGMPRPLDDFTDVREIERRLVEAGITIDRATETDEGPDHLLVNDPDGNLIMFDQFF